jgi:hypothetical protein
MTVSLRALLITLIVASVAWTTREVTGFGFLPLVDDDVNIFYNPHLGAPDAGRVRWMASDISYVHRYMPLGWLGFSVVYAVSGLDPWGYHAADVLLHCANAVLVFIMLGQLLARFQGAAPERDRMTCAALAALLWAVHPLRVETTAWCSGLLYSQAGFLALLSVCLRLAELRSRCNAQVARAAFFLVMGFAAFTASVLTYPVALFLPLAMAIVDHAWLAGAGERRSARLGTAANALVAAVGLALTVAARGTALTSWLRAPSLAQFGPLERLLQAAYVAAVYLWRTCWSGDVRWMPLTLFDAGATGVLGWVALGVLAGVSWLAWRVRGKAPYLLAGWACYLLLVIPNLGLTEHPHTIADRYLYVTGVVFSAVLAFALVRLRKAAALAACELACVGAVIVCARLSVVEARDWRDTPSFQARLMQNPDRDLGHITAARAGKLMFMEGDVRDGRAAVARELQEAPSVGGVVLTWQQVAPAAPLSAAVAATRLQEWAAAPFAFAHAQIAREQLDEGRAPDALLHLDAALVISPRFAEARFRRGIVEVAYGDLTMALHDWLSLRDSGREAARSDYLARSLEKAYAAEGSDLARPLAGRR